jgi:hypothetical protein
MRAQDSARTVSACCCEIRRPREARDGAVRVGAHRVGVLLRKTRLGVKAIQRPREARRGAVLGGGKRGLEAHTIAPWR